VGSIVSPVVYTVGPGRDTAARICDTGRLSHVTLCAHEGTDHLNLGGFRELEMDQRRNAQRVSVRLAATYSIGGV
jgi:hypothetical protein